MPPITRLFVRSSLLYLVAALLAGVLLALRPAVTLPAVVGGLMPVYFHLFMVGWVTQLIVGRRLLDVPQVEPATQPRGYDALALATYLAAQRRPAAARAWPNRHRQ
ncbi:MAG: hypothetical protein V9G19_10795 [Tetrasphaera sp.]